MEIIPETMGYERISEMEQIAMKAGNGLPGWVDDIIIWLAVYLTSGSGSGSGSSNPGSGTQNGQQNIQFTLTGSNNNTQTINFADSTQITPSAFALYGASYDTLKITSGVNTTTLYNGKLDSLIIK